MAIALCAQFAAADTLYLKSGKTLTGIITRETPGEVYLELPKGALAIDRRNIDRVERSATNEIAGLRQGWRLTNFADEKYVPAIYKEIAAAYRSILRAREDARAARRRMGAFAAEDAERQAAAARQRQLLIEVSQKLAVASPSNDVRAYNALVASNNIVRLMLQELIEGRQLAEAEHRQAPQRLAAYMREFDSFEELYAPYSAATNRTPADAAERDFLRLLAVEVSKLRAELSRNEVEYEPQGNYLIVNARLNDKTLCRLIVDTGASQVTLSAAAARRAGLDFAGAISNRIVTADGRQVSAISVIVPSITVGDFRVRNVGVTVLPDSAVSGTDGLLGMSFLGEFGLNINASGGKLILRHFAPKE
jgi:clan AA aspartic protease (TIGR02281 family)